MKCPKCQYISFDTGERCRNCGYEFALAADPSIDPADLPIQNGSEPIGPLRDLSLNETPNLPLFEPGTPADAPMVSARAAPRAPLSVRRPAPAAPRPRPRRDAPVPEPRLALDTADLTGTDLAGVAVDPPRHPEPAVPATGDAELVAATVAARLGGGMIDLLLLSAIDFAVIYFTLRICDLTLDDIRALPVAPLAAFLVLLNGGYLSAFVAAGGQTIGKMAAGTRVVAAAAPSPTAVPFGQAVVRAAAYLVSALPLGAGFVPALAGGERRALHDRLADTRVVKA